MQETDSLLYMPYYNDFHKGNSLRIEQRAKDDSVEFNIVWWYTGKLNTQGAKEIALYMKTLKDKHSY